MLVTMIRDRENTRDDIAVAYRNALLTHPVIDWSEVNRAILERWSVSGLRYVKEKAWAR